MYLSNIKKHRIHKLFLESIKLCIFVINMMQENIRNIGFQYIPHPWIQVLSPVFFILMILGF